MSFKYRKGDLSFFDKEPPNVQIRFLVSYWSGLLGYDKQLTNVILSINDDSIYLRYRYDKQYMAIIPFNSITSIEMCGLDLNKINTIEEYLDKGTMSRELKISYKDSANNIVTVTIGLYLLKRRRKNNEFIELFDALKLKYRTNNKTILLKETELSSSTVKVYKYCLLTVLNIGFYITSIYSKTEKLFIPQSDLLSICLIKSFSGWGRTLHQVCSLKLQYFDENKRIVTLKIVLKTKASNVLEEHERFISELLYNNIIDKDGNFVH